MTPHSASGVVQDAPQLAEMLAVSLASSAAGQVTEDRALGVMLGLAVGNLLGLPVESWPQHEIHDVYRDGLRDIDPLERVRFMDDDLAQAVDLAEALLQDHDPTVDFAARLVRWSHENGRGMGFMSSVVIRELEDRMDMNLNMDVDVDVHDAAWDYWEANGRPSTQPNGGLMRCAPVALRYAHDPSELIRMTAQTCAVTHYAPGAQWSCIVVNAAIALLLRGVSPSLTDLADAASADGAPPELAEWIAEIPPQIEQSIDDEPMIGHTYLCMQAALWCVNTSDDLESALIRIVNAGGDTDTNGAVAGAVLGARFGASAIPSEWLDCIPQRSRIESAAEALLTSTQ